MRLRAVFWVCTCAALLACAEDAPPSLLLVTLDTTRVDHIGAYGYPRPITPNLDALAQESVRFTQAWSPSSWTLPAHASLFTGLQPDAHGARALMTSPLTLGAALEDRLAAHELPVGRLAEEHVTLAELLAARGYRTAAFAGGPWLEPPFGLMQGFEHADVSVQSPEGRRADELTDRALAWLQDVAPGKPFFLFVNYFDPHLPYDPPAGFDDLGATRGAFDPRPFLTDLLAGRRLLSAAEREQAIDRYDGEIAFTDQQLGRLLEVLRARRGGERALVIVTSDHGEAFGEGGRYTHAYWLSEELLRVPLLVRYPDRRGAGSVRDDPIQLTDVLPLVVAEVGLAAPEGLDGVLPGQRSLVTARIYRQKLAIRIAPERFDRDLVAAIQWPFMLLRSDSGESALFRIDAPGEQPVEAPAVAGRLAAQLDQRASTVVPVPAPVPDDTTRRLRELGYIQ